MKIFNFISGMCSIVSLAASIFAVSKVVKINQQISTKENIIQKNKMHDRNIIIGGNFDGTRHK
ncbi:hypothetical protein [Inediibacterium massiliense]|uniref:hypothetical protein n=1 Tax=Inediibacterium massiliense TaxID=1658111 RepID=UPI0006B4B546|nr:hypothetical protein [Inediibacterium massiliense]